MSKVLAIIINADDFNIFGKFQNSSDYKPLIPESDTVTLNVKYINIGKNDKLDEISLSLTNDPNNGVKIKGDKFQKPSAHSPGDDEYLFHWIYNPKTNSDGLELGIDSPDIKFQAIEMSDNSIIIGDK